MSVTSHMRLPSWPQGGGLESDLCVSVLPLLFSKEKIPVNIISDEYLQKRFKVKETNVDSFLHSFAGNFCGSSSATGWYVPVIILFWGSQQEITGDSQTLTMALKATWSQTTFVPLFFF